MSICRLRVLPPGPARTAVLLLTLPLFTAAEGAARELHVAPTGSDSGTCTAAAPCRQIRRAVSLAVAGDTVVVADGTYLGFDLVGRVATAAAPITITAPGRGADIQPTTDRSDDSANIFVYNSSYIVLEGLRSFNGPSYAVRVSHSDHVTVRRGVFGNNATHAIFTGHADDLLIEDNECYGSGVSHGIYLSNSGDRPVVRRNIVHDNAKAGIQLNADASEGGDGIISGALIESNIISNSGTESAAINLDGVQDSVVRNNLIYNNHGSSIALFQIDAAAGSRGMQILHNTIDVAADGRSGLSIKDTVGPIVVRNNILYNRNASSVGLKFGNSTDLANTDSDYNVLDRITPDDGDTVLSLTQWKAQGHESHSLSATPSALWVNSTAANYRLAAASPAIDRGLTIASVTADLEGQPRPAGAASDIGAYEAPSAGSSAQLSIADRTVMEGNAGSSNAVFTVTLSPAAAGAVTVNYATTNGTATAGIDYSAATGTLAFAAGETSKTIPVAVIGDAVDENDETFYVTLSNPTNAAIADGQATGTILDDDVPAVTLSINDASVNEGNSGTTNAVLTVTLSGPATQTITVNYATANGTAAAGSDYTAQSGNLTFTTGQTSKTITVLVNGDTVVEPTEDCVVNLSSPVGATLADGQGQVTITNDDTAPLPTLAIGDVTVTEGNSGTVNARFTVTLSAASASAVTVAYATADGTAGAGSDYAARSGTLTCAAGTTQQFVDVTVNGDTTVESNETFFVNLSSPSGATIGDGQGQGTITNDDTAPLPTLSIGDVTVTEGNSGTVNARFTVTLSAASASAVTVAYATADGTAGAGSDYAAKSGTLTFAAGSTQQFVDVTVNGDTAVESTETFFVNLSGASGATIADGQGQGTITNDDTAPVGSLTIGDVSVTEGNSGTVNARFTVTLSGTSSSAITVAYATANGTGTAGSDYVAKSGTLTFAAGTTQQFVDVTVNGDTTIESNETFFVNLSSPSGATIADGQGQGTIVNDDAAPPPVPTLAIGDATVAEGNSGSTIARFSATLSAVSGSAVTVAYATANGTATAGSDYVATSGTLTFAAGTTQQTIDVTVNGDTTVEPDETFVVNLSSPSGATIADSQGQATIANDDTAAASGVPGDFNGDGQGDLLWHHQQSGDLYTWFMNGVSAASASYLTPSRFADVKWQIRGLADFNGDGRTDVLWHHQKTGELYVWMLNGTVTTAGSYLNPKSFSDTNWQIRATVDFNKDGKPDILWHHQKTGDLYVWFMNGTQVTTGAYLTPSRFADTKWQLRAVMDPNKDGEPDLLWHHQVTGDLYLWFMKGTTAVSGIYLTPSRFTDARWQIVRACDFNKDGTTDLLWHHQASGQLYVWYMTGTTATGGAYLNPPAFTDVQWKVMPR